MYCALCKNPLEGYRIGFRDECDRCGADLHICFNCCFYDQYASKQCREPAIPDAVRDKERRNHCEYFKPAESGPGSEISADDDARRQLESLFKK